MGSKVTPCVAIPDETRTRAGVLKNVDSQLKDSLQKAENLAEECSGRFTQQLSSSQERLQGALRRTLEEVLRTALAQLGHRRGVTRDLLRADLDMLRGHNLVRHEWLEQLLVAHLQERGLDVVAGDVAIEGIAAPKITG